jgi:hypothetical protein
MWPLLSPPLRLVPFVSQTLGLPQEVFRTDSACLFIPLYLPFLRGSVTRGICPAALLGVVLVFRAPQAYQEIHPRSRSAIDRQQAAPAPRITTVKYDVVIGWMRERQLRGLALGRKQIVLEQIKA